MCPNVDAVDVLKWAEEQKGVTCPCGQSIPNLLILSSLLKLFGLGVPEQDPDADAVSGTCSQHLQHACVVSEEKAAVDQDADLLLR
ncbi:hypothetical protein NOSIN_23320 [Nocardiopsis sinuspersici]|uniref:Uncharacterized protein n=1 Tax=Nocardiopsis sinuspersici TaxID=501010 RepID=A0A1V3C791_9ACTN|nr:hypothetical protein NOSIN_23320 [Nocardiopsis sinuspersici]